MQNADSPGDLLPVRVAGEGAPAALPTALALFGTLLAIAAAWLTLVAHPERIFGRATDSRIEQKERKPGVANLEADAQPQPATDAGPSAIRRGPDKTERTTLPTSPMALTRNGAAPEASRRTAEPAALSSRARQDCTPTVNVPFERDSVVPATGRIRADLDALADFLQRHPQAKLSVEGHADASGEDKHNLFLSYRRAKSVLPVLASIGIAQNRVVLSAMGSNALVDGVPADSPQNRRVLLQVRGSSCPAGRADGGQR